MQRDLWGRRSLTTSGRTRELAGAGCGVRFGGAEEKEDCQHVIARRSHGAETAGDPRGGDLCLGEVLAFLSPSMRKTILPLFCLLTTFGFGAEPSTRQEAPPGNVGSPLLSVVGTEAFRAAGFENSALRSSRSWCPFSTTGWRQIR